MLLGQRVQKCDVILVLCSIDERVAEYATELFHQDMGDWLVFSGGIAHGEDLLKPSWHESEAEHFAKIAEKNGVPKSKILVENKAQNTGENIRFSHQLLRRIGIKAKTILLIQKPYMERRTYATFEKQWPEKAKIIVTSPPITYESYFNELNPKETILNIMVGDLQRIKEYPKFGFQTEQPVPENVWQAYENLVKAGYDKHLITFS